MPNQVRILAPTRSAAFVPGGTVTLEVPRMYDIETMYILLTGTVTYGASADAADEVVYAAHRLIDRVELIAGGSNTICTVPGWKLGIATERFTTVSSEWNQFPNPAANATHTIHAGLILDQMIFDGVRPKDGNLRARNFDYLELRITFADWSKVYTNSRSYPASHTLGVQTEIAQCVESDWAASKPLVLVRRSTQVIDASAANAARIIRLPAGNEIRKIDLLCLSGTGQTSATDTLMNSVELRSGIDVRLKGSPQMLRNITRGQRQGGGTYTGLLTLDLAQQGIGNTLMSNNWAVPTPSEPELVIDHNGVTGGQITVVITEYLRLAQ